MSKQTSTVKQHAIKELKLAAKIALCFLSVWSILLIWAVKGVPWGLISLIILVFAVAIILVGRRRIYLLFQQVSTHLNKSRSNHNLSNKRVKTMRRREYSQEANVRMLKCGVPTLFVVVPLIILILCLSGQIKAVSNKVTSGGVGGIHPIPPKPNDQPVRIIKENELATIKHIEREEEKPRGQVSRNIVITREEEIEAPPITAIASEGIKTQKGPTTGVVFAQSDRETYSGPAMPSSGVGGGSRSITNVAQVGAVESGQVQTTTVQIALLEHDFTNYHKHEDTLNNYRIWLGEHTSLRDEDSVQFLRLTARGISSATVLFMTGDDVDAVLSSDGHDGFKQGFDKVRYSFSNAERNALRGYVEDGGTFFFNYGRGTGKFRNRVRNELEQIFGPLVDIPAGHRIYTSLYELPDSARPKLKGIEINGRLAVIFSESDVHSNCRFLTNVLCYALGYGR